MRCARSCARLAGSATTADGCMHRCQWLASDGGAASCPRGSSGAARGSAQLRVCAGGRAECFARCCVQSCSQCCARVAFLRVRGGRGGGSCCPSGAASCCCTCHDMPSSADVTLLPVLQLLLLFHTARSQALVSARIAQPPAISDGAAPHQQRCGPYKTCWSSWAAGWRVGHVQAGRRAGRRY